MEPVAVEQRVYYSQSANLICWATEPRRVIEDGQSKVLDGKKVAFDSQGDGFGRLVTTDPEIIAYLDRRVAEVRDVFGAQEYTRLNTPVDVQLAQKDRQIEEQNRLLLSYQEQIAQAARDRQRKS